MRFILEHQQPVFVLTVYFCCYVDRTGIDLFGFIQFRKLSSAFQHLGTDCGEIHQCLRSLCVLAVDFITQTEIPVISTFDLLVVNSNVLQMRREGRMTAVVRPVCINDTDLGDRRITFLLITEVCLQEGQIIHVHGKTQIFKQSFSACFIESDKAVYRIHVIGLRIFCTQCLRQLQRGFSCLYGVDHVVLDRGNIFFAEITVQGIDTRKGYQRTFTLAQQLNALGRRVCTLIKLSRLCFHPEDNIGILHLSFIRNDIQLRLREDCMLSICKQFFIDALNIIPVQDPDFLQGRETEKRSAVRQKTACFRRKSGFLFCKYSIYHILSYRALLPISLRQ